ncbi:MAG: type II toxin-antitoxin system HicA family toxin [Bacteroidales bacterium]|nr:type II toxin-antitoxin system HicA family toxin [Bacteroidales bacterium]
MKLQKLIKHLEKYGCYLLRQGGNHSIYFNPENGKISAVPRHKEVKNFTAVKICKDLEVPKPF